MNQRRITVTHYIMYSMRTTNTRISGFSPLLTIDGLVFPSRRPPFHRKFETLYLFSGFVTQLGRPIYLFYGAWSRVLPGLARLQQEVRLSNTHLLVSIYTNWRVSSHLRING